MPYKDEGERKRASREAMKRKRQGLTSPGINVQGLTRHPPILEALADPAKRDKLRKICSSLSDRNLLPEVRYGIEGPTMDRVAEILTAFP